MKHQTFSVYISIDIPIHSVVCQSLSTIGGMSNHNRQCSITTCQPWVNAFAPQQIFFLEEFLLESLSIVRFMLLQVEYSDSVSLEASWLENINSFDGSGGWLSITLNRLLQSSWWEGRRAFIVEGGDFYLQHFLIFTTHDTSAFDVVYEPFADNMKRISTVQRVTDHIWVLERTIVLIWIRLHRQTVDLWVF